MPDDATQEAHPESVEEGRVTDGVTQEARLECVEDLISALRSIDAPTPWFRGHIDKGWFLQPSVMRNEGHRDQENDMLKRFKQEGARLTAADELRTEWAWISLAQHHRLPTRLLDWTSNPLVGLYFAVEDEEDGRGRDGRLYYLDPQALNNATFKRGCGILLLGHDQELDNYLYGSANEQVRGPVAVVAQRNFGRIWAQAGAFTLTHRSDPKRFEEHVSVGTLQSWVIPMTAKELIRQQLKGLRIHPASIYDDLDHWAESIKEEFRR